MKDAIVKNDKLIENKAYEHNIANTDIYKSYKNSPYLSIKQSSYFQVYSELFEKYREKNITFVEIGVLNGGSLFMWRDYFGSNVRIIGVDLNPLAKMWEKDGFEIHIGSQSDPIFWKNFFKVVGPVDVILDDGGHTFEQQIVTAHNCIPNINDGGLLVVEDTHTSYFNSFGYPSKYTFIEWTKKLIDNINSRFPNVKTSNLIYKNFIYSITTFESIVSFSINRKKCFECEPTSNDGINIDAKDFRYDGSVVGKITDFEQILAKRLSSIKHIPIVRAIKKYIFGAPKYLLIKMRMANVKKYF